MRKLIVIFAILLVILFLSFYLIEEPEEELPEVSPDELKGLSSSAKDFSFDMFPRLAKDDENVFVSPYSIHTALLMAYRGAGGDSADEMAEVLGLTDMELQAIMEDSLGLKNYLEHSSEENEVSIANAFFLKEGIPFLDSYRSDGERYFEAEIGPLPSTGDPINDWVYQNTNGKIEEIIEPGAIDPAVIAYLVNAVYFKGNWAEEFDKGKTKDRTFYGTDGEADVEMMENKSEYLYYMSEDMQAVTIEYKDGDYLFHAFMPTDDRSLSEFYDDFDSSAFEEYKPDEKKETILRLPKFTLEDELGLVDILRGMGINEVFGIGSADFSDMVDLEAVAGNVFISDVLHASFIEVDEEGVEAAASTAVEIKMESARQTPTIEFNRPFLFLIEEPETETVLFMGHLTNLK
ncbi:MAG: serpin family protein [Patescibacteria group bacterium]